MPVKLKPVQMLNIQELPDLERGALLDMLIEGGLGTTELVNGAAYRMPFRDFFYKDENGEWVRNTIDYNQTYFDMFDLLLKFVPQETLMAENFWLHVWW